MRQNNRIWIILIAVCLLLYCNGYGKKKAAEAVMADAERMASADTEAIIQQQEAEAREQEQRETLQDAFHTVLKSTTKDWKGGYPLNLAFLEWFYQEYGEECVEELAEEARAAYSDQNIWYKLTGNTIHVLWTMYCEQTGRFKNQMERVIWQPCASESEITLAFTGDINFGEGQRTTNHMDQCTNGIQDCFSEDLLQVMNDVDVMMVNNEFTYSTRGEALKGKTYTFRAHPDRAKLLHIFGTDIANLANNHVYDFGPDALLDTMAALDQEGIPYIGAGENLEEASKPYYFICNGRKIAITAATQIERSTNYTKEATEDSPGVLKTLNPDKFVEVIEQARKVSDYVIVFVHWGTEGVSDYGWDQYHLAEAFVEAGADAIIGGHTHCLQGFEIMEGVPIIYSLGNFWFNSQTLDTGLAKITIDASGGLTLSFIPCIQKNLRTSLVTEQEEKQRIFAFLQKHSAKGTIVTEEGIVTQELPAVTAETAVRQNLSGQ